MTDPLHRNLLIGGIVTAIVVAALITWVDVPLALYFNGYRQTWWAESFNFITDFANGGIWYSFAVLMIIVAYMRHRKRTPNEAVFRQQFRAWTFMIITMFTSGTFVNAMKLAIGRERPRLLLRDGTTGFHPFNLNLTDCGFPSGHTQSIWTAMLCLSFIYPPLRPVCIFVALMISASRIVIAAHYAGDVAASIYIAFFAAFLWKRWFEKDGLSVQLNRPSVSAPV